MELGSLASPGNSPQPPSAFWIVASQAAASSMAVAPWPAASRPLIAAAVELESGPTKAVESNAHASSTPGDTSARNGIHDPSSHCWSSSHCHAFEGTAAPAASSAAIE